MQLILPADIIARLATLAPLFSRPVWRHAQTLHVGAILSPSQRTASSAADRWAVSRAHLSSLPSRLESRDLVESGCQSDPVALAPSDVRTTRPTGAGHRRD